MITRSQSTSGRRALRGFTGLCQIAATIAISTSAAKVAAQEQTPLPPSVDLRPDYARFDLPPCVQGSRNTCSLFAVAALAELECGRSDAGSAATFSQEYLTWAANEATGRVGDQAMFYEALCGLNSLGICHADLMPYESDGDRGRRPSDEALSRAKELSDRWRVHWIKFWDVQQPLTDDQMLAIKRALADGHAVACGLRWPNSEQGRDILDVPPADQVYDGHSIVFAGYRDDPAMNGGGVFIFRNSYGPRWGDGGYGTLSYAYARAYANDALWLELGPPGSEVPIQRFEAESLTVLEQQECAVQPQLMRRYGGPMWSGRKQLFGRAADGGWVNFEFDVTKSDRYRVRLLATAAPDYGRIQVLLDGALVDPAFELYSGRVCPAGSLELGTRELSRGTHQVRITIVGKADASTGTGFGIDTLDLLPPL